MKLRACLAALAVATGLSAGMPAQATLFTGLVAFGDSLIDNGAGGMPVRPPSPVYPIDTGGRFTNGPTPTEVLASALGIPLTSYAVGGAFSGLGNVDVLDPADPAYFTGLLSQVNQYLIDLNIAGTPADPNALYTVMGGSNNFLGLLAGNPNPGPGPADLFNLAAEIITDLNTAVGTLYLAGARQFLLPLLPDIGAAPLVLAQLGGAAAADLTFALAQINGALAQSYVDLLVSFGDPQAKFFVFDTFASQQALMATFAIPTDPCTFVGTPAGGPMCANPDQHFFWDELHPTAAVSAALAVQLQQLVPEPPMLLLLATLLLVSAAARRASGTARRSITRR